MAGLGAVDFSAEAELVLPIALFSTFPAEVEEGDHLSSMQLWVWLC
jgi:hypothetical protein